MPWSMENPPPPAKNWPAEAQQKCIAAANGVLKDGGTDEEAIYACIHAAGMSKGGQHVKEAESVELVEAAQFLAPVQEASDGEPSGLRWDVVIIEAGMSKNRTFYARDVLDKATPLFEGVKAYADHPSKREEQDRPERSVRDVVGWFESARMDGDALRAVLHLSEAEESLRRKLLDAHRRGKKDLFGLSINADGDVMVESEGGSGQKRLRVSAINRVRSVDLVTVASAGGRFERLLASERNDDMPVAEEVASAVQAAIEAALRPIRDDITGLRESVTTLQTPPTEEPPSEPETQPTTESPSQTDFATMLEAAREEASNAARMLRLQVSAVTLASKLGESRLPEVVQSRIRKQYDQQVFEEASLVESIREARDELAALQQVPMHQFGTQSAEVTEDAKSKWMKRFEGVYLNEDVDKNPRFRSIREAYVSWMELTTGRPVSFLDVSPVHIFESMRPGRSGTGSMDRSPSMYLSLVRKGMTLEEAVGQRLLETLMTADWAQAYADVMYKTLLRAYALDAEYNDWRDFVSDVENVPDFQLRNWVRLGGFGNLSVVGEGQPYPMLPSPTDEGGSYRVAKYGGLHDITMEAIVNDSISAIRRIPAALARAAKRTLYEDIQDLITIDNPTMDYDSVALYNQANHANDETTALSVLKLATVVRAMRRQTAYGEAGAFLGRSNYPKILIVPPELEQLANRIVSPSTQYVANVTNDADQLIDPTEFAGKGIMVKVNDRLTDTNNWYVMADPRQMPTVIVGFLNGQEQPELLVQDNPQTGSVFTADKVTTKVRLIYGMDVTEHRSFYRNVVTGG